MESDALEVESKIECDETKDDGHAQHETYGNGDGAALFDLLCFERNQVSPGQGQLLLNCNDLFDEGVFGEAFCGTFLVEAVDSVSIRVQNRAVLIEVVAEDTFGYDFFFRSAAANQFPRFGNQCRRAVIGAVGGLVSI